MCLADEMGPQLIQEQKEQERKDRTNRLCKRMGFIEKLLPGTIATAPAQGAGTAGRGNTQPTIKTTHTAQEDGADGGAAQG